MNIFYIDPDPVLAAQQLCDKHVVKMGLESVQMLCTTHHHFKTINIPYRKAYYNHPCTIWVRQSLQHYNWLTQHAQAIFNEYILRYNKTHKSQLVLEWCLQNNIPLLDNDFIEPPKCMSPEYQIGNTVDSYRKFYNEEKVGIKKLTWDKAPHQKPSWIYL